MAGAARHNQTAQQEGMTPMSKTGWLLLTALMLGSGPALGAPLPADLGQAAKAYDQAQLTADPAALGRLLADDYLRVSDTGANATKAQFIAERTDPDYRPGPFSVDESITRVWADGAVMGGVTVLSGTDHGKPLSGRIHFADVWAKRGGRWQVVYTQITKGP
jgi:hypothetical protein